MYLLFLVPLATGAPPLLACSACGADGPATLHVAAAPTPPLERVVVTGTRPPLTPPTVEAARERLDTVPGGMDVIDAAQYRDGRVSTLADALEYSPGVFVAPRFGAEEARLSIRGSGLQRTFHLRGIKLLQDGVPLNLADGSGDFQAVEPLANRYIEVYRGANALQYGSATLGGAINFVSPTGRDEQPTVARAEFGSFAYRRLQAQAGSSAESLDWLGSISHHAQDGFRQHARQDTQRFFGNLGWRVRDDVESRFHVALVRTDSELPGNTTRAELYTDPRVADPNNVRNDYHRDFDLARIANRTVAQLAGDQRIEAGAYFARKRLFHPIFQVIEQDSDDLGLDARYLAGGHAFGLPQRLTVGVAASQGKVQDDRFQNIGGAAGARTNELATTARNVELYAEEQLEVAAGTWLVAGAQATQAARKVQDQYFADGADNSLDRTYARVSPKLGLLRELTPAVQLFANVSGAYEPPSFGELTGGPNVTPVDAQRATSIEAGSRGSAPALGGTLRWDVVGYWAGVRKELLSLTSPSGTPLGTVNADRTVHRGLETGAALDGSTWILRAAWQLSDFRFVDDPVYGNRPLAGVPRQFAIAEALWRLPHGLRLGPNVRAASRSWVDHANTLAAAGYAVFGLKLTGRHPSGLAWFVDARNLGDRTYAASTGVTANAGGLDARQFLPGDGRSVYAGLEYRL